MCGRFFQHRTRKEVAAAFRAELGESAIIAPRYNIPPSAQVLTVRFNAKNEQRTLDALHWGLIPHFAKDRKAAYRCSNARAETLDTKASFRGAFQRRRCIVPIDGFFEWMTGADRKKHPYAIAMRDHHLFGVAGLWENWQDPSTGQWIRSVALVTTEANTLVGQIHDRMPAILAPEHHAAWLGESDAEPAALKQLLRPYSAEAMVMWPVSDRVNAPRHDDVTLLDEVVMNAP